MRESVIPHAPSQKTPERGDRERPEDLYDETLNRLARGVIYNEEKLDAVTLERRIRDAMRIPKFEQIEQVIHGFESCLYLLKGIEAHERANAFQNDDWQAALAREGGAPETLTRGDVADTFDHFRFKGNLVSAESAALEHYQRLLGLGGNTEIRLDEKISIERSDIEVLVNDLRTRMTERNPDDEERRGALEALDRELAEIADGIPDDQRGKRFEIEEMYLLRRLTHAADTGHLASIGHGTPREDLRRDRGSVDITVTAAGDVIPLQVKTFKRKVSRETREKQNKIIEEARRRLEGSPTHLVVLWAEDVQDAYDRALRHPAHERTSLEDKYAALQPITDSLDEDERHRLLALTGLTEKDFKAERADFERKQAEIQEVFAKSKSRKEEEDRRIADVEEQRRREEEDRIAKAQAKLDEDRRRHEEARAAADEEHQKRAKAAQEKIIPVATLMEKTAEAERLKAEQEAREAEEERKRKRKEEIGAKRKATIERKKMEEAKVWKPKSLVGLCNVTVLKNLGLLQADWSGDVPAYSAAKKRFFRLFAALKKGETEGSEFSKPNAYFSEVFPSEEILRSPSADDIDRWRSMGIGSRMDVAAE